MDAWNKDHHGKSGLTAKVPNGMDPDFVEAKMIDLINKHFPDSMTDLKKRPILAGNSIMQDRLFIDKYFKKLSSRLHYRMVDVSSFKIMLNNKYNLEYRKQNSHRALDDIRESIGELKFYLNSIQKN
jgi:oligoribonuclease